MHAHIGFQAVTKHSHRSPGTRRLSKPSALNPLPTDVGLGTNTFEEEELLPNPHHRSHFPSKGWAVLSTVCSNWGGGVHLSPAAKSNSVPRRGTLPKCPCAIHPTLFIHTPSDSASLFILLVECIESILVFSHTLGTRSSSPRCPFATQRLRENKAPHPPAPLIFTMHRYNLKARCNRQEKQPALSRSIFPPA